jgi:hypothetical protein
MAGVMVDHLHAIVGQAQVARHLAAPLALGERRLAGGWIEEAELRAELARPARQTAPRRLQAHAVIAARIGLVAHHPVHPVVGWDARSREHHAIHVARSQAEVREQRVDGAPRVAGVVLQAGKPLLGGAADDFPVSKDGRGRAVGLADP